MSKLVNPSRLGYPIHMTKIRNLTGSPYDLAPGVILPAFGEVDADLPEYILEVLNAVPGVEVVALTPDADPLDEWRKMYTDLTGKKPHHLWKEERLIAEIEKASGE